MIAEKKRYRLMDIQTEKVKYRVACLLFKSDLNEDVDGIELDGKFSREQHE